MVGNNIELKPEHITTYSVAWATGSMRESLAVYPVGAGVVFLFADSTVLAGV
jgi:hypothetical protein